MLCNLLVYIRKLRLHVWWTISRHFKIMVLKAGTSSTILLPEISMVETWKFVEFSPCFFDTGIIDDVVGRTSTTWLVGHYGIPCSTNSSGYFAIRICSDNAIITGLCCQVLNISTLLYSTLFRALFLVLGTSMEIFLSAGLYL